MCLGAVGMSLHHKLCHVLGGSFDLPHAETHTVVLPHAVAYSAPAVPEAMARIARALGRASGPPDEAATALYELADQVGAARSLGELGMPAGGLDRAADLAVANPYWSPRPLERAAIRELLERAFTGAPPR
jgi:alcohol dehydrogenase class IV